MKRRGQFIRKALFHLMPFETYLKVLSRIYFISFRTGMLKSNKLYEYNYFLKNIVGEGDICMDVGANLGYYTVTLSKLVGKHGKVYAVEPVLPVLSVLRSNTRRLSNVEVYPYALGTENKEIRLGNFTTQTLGYLSSGGNYILDEHLSYPDPDVEFDAQMKRGSELFAGLERLDFIKIDIEGYETVVVPELKPLLLKHRPILLIESRYESRKEMLDFFQSIDYKAFVLSEGKLYPAKPDEYWDILFVPESSIGRVEEYIEQ